MIRGRIGRRCLSPFLAPLPLLGLLVGSVATFTPEIVSAQLIAEQITALNFETHHVGGPDSDAGIGDWFLSNGLLCAAISDPSHESPLSPAGGILIDLGHCGRNDDQWAVMQPMFNLAQSEIVRVDHVEAGQDEKHAWIQTRGNYSGVAIQTRFQVSRDSLNLIEVETRIQREQPGKAFFALGNIFLHASAQLKPYSLLLNSPGESFGFEYPASDRESLMSLLGGLHRANLIVLVGQDALTPISYGIELESASPGSNPGSAGKSPAAYRPFSVVGEHFTSINTLTAPLWFGEDTSSPSLFDLIRIPWMDVSVDEPLYSRTKIWISEQGDVASIADRFLGDEPLIAGKLDEPDAQIEITRIDGSPVSFLRPQSDGSFALRIHPGRYVLDASASGNRHKRFEFEVEEGIQAQPIPPFSLGKPARVELPLNFSGRLVFLHTKTGRPARFADMGPDFKVGEERYPSGLESNFINVAAQSQSHPLRKSFFAVPPGPYRVLATRGTEYALQEAQLTVSSGMTALLDLSPLERILPSPGWISADLHVHTGASFDSNVPPELQMLAFAASGTEVLVATEHDRIAAPEEVLKAAQLGNSFALINGVEITSAFEGGDSPNATGHWNAFPIEGQALQYRGGAPTLEGRRARDAIADLRATAPQVFLQLNHPRPGLGDEEGDTYFSHLGVAGVPYEPTLPLDQWPNEVLIQVGAEHPGRDLDYDGVELLNGPDLVRYRRVRADWFSLLLQGEEKTGVASSDSHQLSTIVGIPRTYIRMRADSVANFSQPEFIKALKAGRAFGSTGPLLEARIGDAGIGDRLIASQGILEVEIKAAPWVGSNYQWRVFVNGELVHQGTIIPAQPARLPLAFAKDSFVTIEIEGEPTADYSALYPGCRPFAFSNPIYIDADADGAYEAPGLPAVLPPSLRSPDTPD